MSTPVSQGVDTTTLSSTSLSYRGKYRLGEHARNTVAYLNRGGPLLVEYKTLRSLQAMGYSLDPDRDNKSKYEPQVLVDRLARYGKPSVLTHADRDILKVAQAMTMRAFGGKGNLRVSALDDHLRKVTYENKSSGLPDLTSKGDAFERDLGRAQRIAGGSKAPEPCIAFFRVQHGDKGPKTRLVWGYPQSVFLLEAMFAPQLIEHFLSRRDIPMAFGMFKSQVSARMQSIRNSGVRYSMDFSGFDSTIPAALVDFAFSVLKTHFEPMTEDEERIWYQVVRYFIHTPIMMPDCTVWVKHHGVPSGSYFTQLIDSIVNYCAVNYAFMRAGGTPIPDDKILVLGDDSLVGQSTEFRLDDLAKYFLELGLTLSVEKTEVSYQGKSDPHFLGHYWRRGYPDRDPNEIAKRMCFPEKLSGIKDGRTRRAVRNLSYVPDAVSAHKIAVSVAPVKARSIQDTYASFVVNEEQIEEISPRDRPGWAANLEEYGTAEPISAVGLAIRQPFTGLYF